MRKIIHKLIRYSNGQTNVVADLNVAIATGNSGTSHASIRSESRIVQRNGRSAAQSAQQPHEKEVNDGKEEDGRTV